jgi:hypothetical protein
VLIDRHPDARFIIDHLGILQPSVQRAPPQPWADLPKMLDLAKRKNAVVQIFGACTLSQQPYPLPDIWAPSPAYSTRLNTPLIEKMRRLAGQRLSANQIGEALALLPATHQRGSRKGRSGKRRERGLRNTLQRWSFIIHRVAKQVIASLMLLVFRSRLGSGIHNRAMMALWPLHMRTTVPHY